MASLLEEIAPAIAQFASEKGLRVVSQQHDPSSFGNAVIEMASVDFDLRVVRDRGEVAVEVSPSGKADWHTLQMVLGFITKQTPAANPGSLARALTLSFEQVNVLMAGDLSEAGLLAFEKQQAAAFLKKLFPAS